MSMIAAGALDDSWAEISAETPIVDAVIPSAPNPMLDLLVDGDKDLVGLFAYSLQQQHENDWALAFHELNARAPQASDIALFHMGEMTERRRQHYRREAQWRLAERAQNHDGATNARQSLIQRVYIAAHTQGRSKPSQPPTAASAIPAFARQGALAVVVIGLAVVLGVYTGGMDTVSVSTVSPPSASAGG